jgi:hypothetical protein
MRTRSVQQRKKKPPRSQLVRHSYPPLSAAIVFVD